MGVPSIDHETLIELFRARPTLAGSLISAQGVEIAAHDEVRLESAELTDCKPAEYRADAVIVYRSSNKPVLGVVVEVQLSVDDDKRWSWPVYLATLRARLRCDVILLVVCLTDSVARACAVPIDMGHPGWTLVPEVTGRDLMPRVTDPAQAAAEPELATLSVACTDGSQVI